jgi:hypothetical protein
MGTSPFEPMDLSARFRILEVISPLVIARGKMEGRCRVGCFRYKAVVRWLGIVPLTSMGLSSFSITSASVSELFHSC